jgi:hypothetical protein
MISYSQVLLGDTIEVVLVYSIHFSTVVSEPSCIVLGLDLAHIRNMWWLGSCDESIVARLG